MAGTYVRLRPGAVHRDTAPLDQRLMLMAPALTDGLRRLILGLPPRSRLRQIFLKRAAQLAFSAYERGEFHEPIDLFYSPDIELHGGGLGDIGPDMSYTVHGRDEVRRWVESWHEPFAWIRWEIPELLDFGDAVVLTAHQVAQGRASGIQAEMETYSTMRFDDGFVTWQRWYRDRDEALEEVGVDPASVPAASGS